MSTVLSPVSGTRTEPKDGYRFVRGTQVTFKVTFVNNGAKTKVDNLTVPVAKIAAPRFLQNADVPSPQILATINGVLTPGQEFEYQFVWDIPADLLPLDEYIVSYQGFLGGMQFNFGDEYFEIVAHAGQVGTLEPAYATVDDVRRKKFNIDDFLPDIYKKDLGKRNQLIEDHLRDASHRLREELSLFKARSYSENYRLFVIYYTIWSLLLASRGEDGSAVSDQNIMFWRQEWERILAQEKREGVMQGIPLGRG